jgi:TolB protein
MWSVISADVAQAQFRGRYPLISGYRNHNYFEGYEMPVLGTGPNAPTATPDGRALIFSAKGWLWNYSLETGVASRITSGGESDFRPAISPDGSKVAFVRDDTRTTKIMLLNLRSGEEHVLVESGLIDLDPAFSSDGNSVYYSSSQEGDLDIWRIHLASGEKIRITEDRGLEMRPIPLPGDTSLVLVAKGHGGGDRLALLNLRTGEYETLRTEATISQMWPSVSPNGKTIVVNWPAVGNYQDYQLWALDTDESTYFINLTYDLKLPLTPTFSADGKTIYFVEADAEQTFRLYEIPLVGGAAKELTVASWNWNAPTGRLVVRSHMEGEDGLLPTRVNILDGNGHPLYPNVSNARFDSQNGQYYFHSPGEVEVTAPAGAVTVTTTHGFVAAPATSTTTVAGGAVEVLDISLNRLWNPREQGWYSGDLHFHLNYGGPYYLTPAHLIPMAEAEDLDVGVPMTANLHTRLMDKEWINWTYDDGPIIHFGQEVRDHFLGHVGLAGIKQWYDPWFYGPYYPVYGNEDRPNSRVLEHTRQQDGLSIYVHPIYGGMPFDEDNLGATPVNLIPDAMLGQVDALEIACIWITELGTSDLLYRLLNVGVEIVPTGGSDTFPNYFRHMIFGTDRTYAHVDGAFTFDSFLDAVKAGRSFTTNGPLLDFHVDELEPGEVLPNGGRTADWSLEVYSPLAVERVEILVNGEVVASYDGLGEAGGKSYSGSLQIPENGWIAARVHGGEMGWPMMETEPFAHTAPIWIARKGSRDPSAASAAAIDLLRALDVAEQRVDDTFAGTPIPDLKAQFLEARRLLEALAN